MAKKGVLIWKTKIYITTDHSLTSIKKNIKIGNRYDLNNQNLNK